MEAWTMTDGAEFATVFALTQGEYSDYGIVGIFRTARDARDAWDASGGGHYVAGVEAAVIGRCGGTRVVSWWEKDKGWRDA
jgi:hypothetical protein